MNYIALFLVAVVRWFVCGGSRVSSGLVNGLLGNVNFLGCLVGYGFLGVRLFLVDGLRCGVGRNGVNSGFVGLVVTVSVGSDGGNDGDENNGDLKVFNMISLYQLLSIF